MSLLQTWIDYVAKSRTAQQTGPESREQPSATKDAPPKTYFASTSLELRTTNTPDEFPADVYLDNICYRRVDLEYFAWLRHKMQSAKHKYDSGRLPRATWDTLRARFNKLQEWTLGCYGKSALEATLREFDPACYAPPVNIQPPPFLFPKTGDWRFSRHVDPASVRKVDAIRDEAHAKGWSDERLYKNRGRFKFPLGQEYGLVCFVDPDYELGQVSESYIEIIIARGGRRVVQRFANADVFPPRLVTEGTLGN